MPKVQTWVRYAAFGFVLVASLSAIRSWRKDSERRTEPARQTIAPGEASPRAREKSAGVLLDDRAVPSVERWAISGLVRAVGGAPLPQARVCLAPSGSAPAAFSATCSSSQWPCTECATADDEGRFALSGVGALENGVALASASGYLPVRKRLPPARLGQDITIVLELESGGAELAGRVVDLTGGAVAMALVTVEPFPGGSAPIAPAGGAAEATPMHFALTDESGQFRLSVTPGALLLHARAEAYSDALLVTHAPATQLSLVLAPASAIAGQVLSLEDSRPVADVSITALCKSGEAAGSRTAQSGPDGTFRLGDLPACLYELTAIARTFRSQPEIVGVGIAETSRVTLRVARAVPVTGDVLVDGAPCPHGRGTLVGPSSGAVEIREGGRLCFDGVLPGQYSLEVECDGAVALREVFEVSSEPLQRKWELESGLRLLGRVESTRAQPVGGAIVNVHSLDGGPGARSCSSDESGDFVCSGLVPGRYQCVSSNRHGKVLDHATVDLDASSAPFVVLRTPSLGTIRASVRGNAPDPAGLRVFARHAGDFPVRGVASEGVFIFEDLPLGRYLVSIGRARERPAPEDSEVSLSRDGEVVDVTVARPALASIEGRVVDMRGDPIGDARVRVEVSPLLEADETAVDARCVTDENGDFVLGDLPPGHYDLIASTAFGEVALESLAAGTRNVRMVLRDYGAISGVVRRPLGDPLTSFQLSYESEEGAKSDQINSPDGAWSLPWLAPGDYALSVTSSEGSASARVALGAGERETVILTLAGRE